MDLCIKNGPPQDSSDSSDQRCVAEPCMTGSFYAAGALNNFDDVEDAASRLEASRGRMATFPDQCSACEGTNSYLVSWCILIDPLSLSQRDLSAMDDSHFLTTFSLSSSRPYCVTWWWVQLITTTIGTAPAKRLTFKMFLRLQLGNRSYFWSLLYTIYSSSFLHNSNNNNNARGISVITVFLIISPWLYQLYPCFIGFRSIWSLLYMIYPLGQTARGY